MPTKKMLTEDKAQDTYANRIIVIGPEEGWPTEVPDGTLIIRTETPDPPA